MQLENSVMRKRWFINTYLFLKNDKYNLQNRRPITLSNIDYKIAAYARAIRLKNVMPNIISTDQNGNTKNRLLDIT